ncbi:MMPL family transporter [Streptomyces nanshensis]|uniref:SSD domain-containing protein n=1 Tax=Streptomyces nanshensis TaxID=518642 RepID=A0A1E7L9Q4_9ACTN|nr:MMPL family transporter [Streptomyces nanshensis]OEV12939.1 hypothetical protein AN218_06035 [Streptomyces nanshensis]
MRSLLALPAGRRAKWLVLGLWLALVVVLGPLAGKLFSITQDDYVSYLPQSAESTRVVELRQKITAGSDQRAAVVYERSSGVTPADKARAERDLEKLKSKFTEADNGRPIRVETSRDGKALVYGITLPPNEKGKEGDAAKDAVKEIRATTGTGGDGLHVWVGGPAGVLADQLKSFEGLDVRVLLATVGVVAVLLLLIYRSPVLWLVPLLTVGLGAEVGQALVYAVAKDGAITVTSLSAFILVVLTYGAGTDYALLLIARYREELRRHEDRHEAMKAALRNSGPAIMASAATVGAGLLCLLAADLTSNKGLGPIGLIGVASALLAMLVLLPALLVILGRWVFWPAIPHYGSQAKESTRLWSRVASLVSNRPRRTWLVTAAGLVVLSGGLLTMNTDLREADGFRDRPESISAQDAMMRHFEPGLTRPAHVISNEDKADEVLSAVRGTPGVASAQPAGSRNGTALTIVTLDKAPDSDGEHRVLKDLRERVHAVPGGDALVGGHSAINMDLADSNVEDAKVVIPFVLLVILVILGLLLRAVTAPLVLIATVVVSFAAALGVSTLVFEGLFGFPAVDSSLPLLAFVFLVALGVDYNIFLMGRIHEEAARHGTRQGTVRGLTVTGGVITSAGIVLAATFAVLTVLPLVLWIELGFVVALGILLDTFIVRSVLVPALTVDLDRRMWWPSRLSRRPADDGTPGPRGDGPGANAEAKV